MKSLVYMAFAGIGLTLFSALLMSLTGDHLYVYATLAFGYWTLLDFIAIVVCDILNRRSL